MLSAVALAGADRCADHQRHGRLGAAHVVPFAGLVRDLVGCHQREVHVHQLHDRAQSDHGGADRGAADGRLRDRRVEDPLTAERLEQAPRELERAAVIGDVLAVEDDPGVPGHLLLERGPERIAIEHALRRQGRWLERLVDDRGGESRGHRHAAGPDVQVAQKLRRFGVGGSRGALCGARVALECRARDGRQGGLIQQAGLHQSTTQLRDRVDCTPRVLFVPRAVLIPRIGE